MYVIWNRASIIVDNYARRQRYNHVKIAVDMPVPFYETLLRRYPFQRLQVIQKDQSRNEIFK